jgi:hypothetical protein
MRIPGKTPGSAEHGGGASWVAYALDRDTGTIFLPVGNPGPDYQKAMREGANAYTISVVALDAKAGALKWWYQLRANDDHDWDATNVSLFDAGGRKLVATSGKQGILHVVDRATGALVFKLPVTTTLNQDAPITPEGVRVCPVAGVQWNGVAHSPTTGLLYINAIDWCSTFKLGPEPKWEATVPYTGSRTAGAPTIRPTSGTGGSTRRSAHGHDGVARENAVADVRGDHGHRRKRPVHRQPRGRLPRARRSRRAERSTGSTPAGRSPAAS